MGTQNRVLTFGDDGSPGSDLAWDWITSQQWPGWTVDVVSVTAPAPELIALFTHEPLHEHQPDMPRSSPPAAQLTDIRHLTTAADPRIVLCEKSDADLTVIGARGQGPLKSMMLGSTADWLMRCPSTPLIIAREGSPVHRVLVCVDGSTHAGAAVDALLTFPWLTSCEVEVLAVFEGDDALRGSAQETVDRLSAIGVTVSVRVLEPDPEALTINPRDRILDEVRETGPDLVVLGTAGRTGWSRLMVGSVAGAVAHTAPCSVLMAHRSSE
jgi:nucleotide-binding universal stress UspA family protein